MSSRHVLDIASETENSYPIDQLRNLRNRNERGGGGSVNDQKPAPNVLKKMRTKKTTKTRTMKKKTSKYAIPVQMKMKSSLASGMSVRELREKVRLHQEKMTTLGR